MKRKIVFIGKSGSGKDYIAKSLSTHLFSEGMYVKRFAFADPVKKHIAILLNITQENFEKFLHDEDFKNHTLISLSKMKIVASSDKEHKHIEWENSWNAKRLNDYIISNQLRYEDIDDLDVYMSLRDFTVFYGTNVMQKCLGRRVWCHAIFNSKEYKINEEFNGVSIITDCRFPHEFNECQEKGFVFVKVEDKSGTSEKLDNIAESYIDMFHYDYLFENDKTDKDKFQNEMEKFIEWLKS